MTDPSSASSDNSRRFDRTNLILTKVVKLETKDDLNILRLNATETVTIVGDISPISFPEDEYTRNLTVYDKTNESFHVTLVGEPASDYRNRAFFFTGGWNRFIWYNDLKTGDVIEFYKIKERDEAGRSCYVVNCIKGKNNGQE
ncbi:hypothetical protein M569_12661 [Genlisea aurea]|uniref:TF-B3 domain-containing protein n=1 Tax=Genlisea aurea TaxID=192259 RepID=S8DQR3_9LAMI|nr:hypothetical protein M569_12661 [Genlisea aurea]